MQTLLKSTDAYKILYAERKNLRHAYLLHFSDAKSLRPALKELAKLFFDENDARIAKLIEKERFSDCLFYPDEGKRFSVEDAERLFEEATLKPVEGERKLFVVSDFSLATPQAQNKLLKVLEEPPAGVYFLLGASSLFTVLSTVLSRVEKLEIPPFNETDVAAYLRRNHPLLSEFAGYASASCGSVGTAEEMIDGGFYSELLFDAFSLALADECKLPALAKKIGETKHKKELISMLRMIFRDALFIQLDRDKRLPSGFSLTAALALPNEKDRTCRVAEKYCAAALLSAQDEFSLTEKDIKFNGIFSQRLELCFASIAEKNVCI
ncbi:MAG: hypothetical protein IJY62_03300 [Clostridia bacterium]|nr:hypothetical protein [Clostridia bacterium]